MAATAAADPSAPLLPKTVAQLVWLGVDPDSVRALTPYVALLPTPTKVNANTAPREVLVAAIGGLDLASAERLVQVRQQTPFAGTGDVTKQFPQSNALDISHIDVRSSYFEVRGRLRLGDRVLDQTSLIWRNGNDMVVLQRQRTPGRDTGAS
jgi:general secretion pathway protein K